MSSCAETPLRQKKNWFLLLSIQKISHCCSSQPHYFISQPFHHVCLLLKKTLASQKQAITFDENFIATPPSYLKNISLLLSSVTLLYLSTIPPCLSTVGKHTSEPETSYCLQWKLYWYSSQSSLTPENFISLSTFCRSFVFLLFTFWYTETTTANLQDLTLSNPS